MFTPPVRVYVASLSGRSGVFVADQCGLLTQPASDESRGCLLKFHYLPLDASVDPLCCGSSFTAWSAGHLGGGHCPRSGCPGSYQTALCASPCEAGGLRSHDVHILLLLMRRCVRFLCAPCALRLFALFIVIHALIPTFLFFKIPSFMIFNMAHLSSSYLPFFTGISCLN